MYKHPLSRIQGGKVNTYQAPEFWPEQQANSMPNKQARSRQSAVPFKMSTQNQLYHDLQTPQSADEQLDLNERSESFKAETTPNPQDNNDEAILDPQTTNNLIQ
jgi:hypothetical protein